MDLAIAGNAALSDVDLVVGELIVDAAVLTRGWMINAQCSRASIGAGW